MPTSSSPELAPNSRVMKLTVDRKSNDAILFNIMDGNKRTEFWLTYVGPGKPQVTRPLTEVRPGAEIVGVQEGAKPARRVRAKRKEPEVV